MAAAGFGVTVGYGTSEVAAQSGSAEGASSLREPGEPRFNPLAHDRRVWQQLLSDAPKIRRVVIYTERGVEATTESDDPEVIARLQDHAFSMQARMEAGARVRMWDPIFAELFAQHKAVEIHVEKTDNGVKIEEWSDDPEVVALLWSHAAGVSDFVREGHEAGRRPTERIGPGTVPPPEAVLGGIRHRFILHQPSPEELEMLRELGVQRVISFRPTEENPDYDQADAVESRGMRWVHIPFSGPDDLDSTIIDASRRAFLEADAAGETAAIHCRTGNRAGPGWIAYRVLDKGVSREQAFIEARTIQMITPEFEQLIIEYLDSRSKDDSGEN